MKQKQKQPSLLDVLRENNDFFDMMVDMIPSKLYIAGNSGDDYNPKNPYYKKPGADSKEARRAAAKTGKRKKFDPSQAESTVVEKARIDREQNPSSNSTIPPATPATAPDTNSNNHSRIEALRAKLHAKIAEKQAKRPLSADQVSKRAARRIEKEKRRKEATLRKKAATTQVQSVAAHYRTLEEASTDLTQLDFGRIEGLNNNNSQSSPTTLKRKNLHKALADAVAKRQKLEELKAGTDEEKAKAAAMQWSDTLKEADGQRQKDNPAKLAKKLKRKEASKRKSKKAWKTRTEQTMASKAERQQIRRHNLSTRKKGGAQGANLSSKQISTQEDSGKRLSRAGFEGRNQEFLNSPKDRPKKN